jgi:hypothetical protein
VDDEYGVIEEQYSGPTRFAPELHCVIEAAAMAFAEGVYAAL